MKQEILYPRYALTKVREALADTPVVLIHGPRQCGKTTLARMVGGDDYAYFTFDDVNILAAAQEDPIGFVERLPERTILDEVQRCPDLFSSLKKSIDQNRKPGRLLMTGSANVLLLPNLSDSLAGRMEIVPLHPLSQCEIANTTPCFIDELFSGFKKIVHAGRLGDQLAERILHGGYPEPQKRGTWKRKRQWYRNYSETLVQRDIQALARIRRLDAIPKLLELAAGQTSRLLNISELASPFQLSRPTIRDYAELLERIFLISFLPPWYSNRIKRLIKTPKLHLGDTGLACSLLNLDLVQLSENRTLLGQLLETFIYNELKRQAGWHDSDLSLYHYRDKDLYEVDLVIQQDGNAIAGIEIKAAGTVKERDFRGLRRLQQATAKTFFAGVVLYDGDHLLPFGEKLYGVPISALWGKV